MKPSALPKIRAELLADNARIVADMSRTPSLAQDPALRAQQITGQRLPNAGLFLVARSMTEAAVDAARDVPPTTLIEVWPEEKVGIMLYEGGLPPAEALGSSVRPEVMTWCHDGAIAYFALWARASTAPPSLQELTAASRLAWIPVVSAQTDLLEPLDLESFSGVNAPRCVSLALATWIMMTTPTVADARTTTASGPRIGNGRRRDTAREVNVIELRRLAHKPTEPGDSDGLGREYRHRWIVRGHWRQQPHGPGRSQRRTTWVPSYVKGPEDAPFLPSESVFVWRR